MLEYCNFSSPEDYNITETSNTLWAVCASYVCYVVLLGILLWTRVRGCEKNRLYENWMLWNSMFLIMVRLSQASIVVATDYYTIQADLAHYINYFLTTLSEDIVSVIFFSSLLQWMDVLNYSIIEKYGKLILLLVTFFLMSFLTLMWGLSATCEFKYFLIPPFVTLFILCVLCCINIIIILKSRGLISSESYAGRQFRKKGAISIVIGVFFFVKAVLSFLLIYRVIELWWTIFISIILEVIPLALLNWVFRTNIESSEGTNTGNDIDSGPFAPLID
eukprot:TRINITY_DN10462_c0_g1_i1.p1 TRINITY_DN10462_c0_g1~~TRINITY_DN10462_c0_g1_i1.p1  ORF type:complete len:276 (-),score=-0.87 TRINITY_DN10462_c0_g1_i1:76-903(-)